MKLICCLAVLMVVVHNVQCYNVLFMLPFGSKSHKNVFDPVAEELAKRGNKVVMLTSLGESGEANGVRNVVAADIKSLVDTLEFSFFQGSMNNASMMTLMFGLFYEMTDIALKDPFLVDLIREPIDPLTKKPKYDIVVIDAIFNDFSLAVGHHLGIPNIIFSPSGYFYHHAWHLNIPYPISYIPNALSDISEPMGFVDRMRSSFSNLFFLFMMNNIALPNIDVVIKKHLPSSPPLTKLISDVSFIFSHSHPVFNVRMPSMPFSAEVGGLNCKPAKPLREDLDTFMNSALEDGVIYFSLGSVTKGETMPAEMRDKIIEVFSRLPQKIIWKYEKPISQLPKNIKLMSWAPQADILGHPNIRLFITHGGQLSINEAIYNACPFLGFPLSADQLSNMALARKHGIGQSLDWRTFTTQTLLHNINQMLSNSSYKENILKMASVFKDQLQHPAEKASYWIEYVARHEGAPFLKPPAKYLNFFQYFLLDVIALAIALLFLVAIVAFYLVKCAFKFGLRMFTSNSSKPISKNVKKKRN